jgi:hypothetical protein
LGARQVCANCRKRRPDTNHRRTPLAYVAPSPIWKRQLGFLLACTKRVGLELFGQQCASNSLRNFPASLALLMKALLRLHRSSARTDGAGTRIEVEHSSDNSCAMCGGPVVPASETVS